MEMHAPVSPVAGLSQEFAVGHLVDANAGTAMREATRMIFNIVARSENSMNRIKKHQLEPTWTIVFCQTCTAKREKPYCNQGEPIQHVYVRRPLWILARPLSLERPKYKLIKSCTMPPNVTLAKLLAMILSRLATGASQHLRPWQP